MQWDASPNAGFTAPGVTPWLPLAAGYAARNVAAQDGDPASMLAFFRRLASLRRAEPALHRGDYVAVDLGIAEVLAYRRTAAGHDSFLVAINFGVQAQTLDLRVALDGRDGTLELSTNPARTGVMEARAFVLAGYEGAIIRLAANE